MQEDLAVPRVALLLELLLELCPFLRRLLPAGKGVEHIEDATCGGRLRPGDRSDRYLDSIAFPQAFRGDLNPVSRQNARRKMDGHARIILDVRRFTELNLPQL
jgi:hypothetical protein